jgi:CheY-like chemotaxis protein
MNRRKNNNVILMVDDDPDDFFIVREILREKGFENDIRLCSDGEELMDYLMGSYPDIETCKVPGVILLDLNMPKMDGRQTLVEIKENEALRYIPVIVLTTSTDPGDIDFCHRAGADAYIEKSQSFEALSAALSDTIRIWMRKTRDPAAGKRCPDQPVQ